MFCSDALIFDVAAAGIINDIFYVQTVYFSQNRLLVFRVSAIELPCIAAYPLGSSDFFINIKNDIFMMLYCTQAVMPIYVIVVVSREEEILQSLQSTSRSQSFTKVEFGPFLM